MSFWDKRRPAHWLVSLGFLLAGDSVAAQDWLVARAQSGDDEAEAASYFQYEPQNLDVPTPPVTVPETLVDGMSVPEITPPQLPWIAPYGTSLNASWTVGSGDQLGITDIDLRQTLVFPRQRGFMISVGSSLQFLSGPETVDLPETLYGHWVEFRWMKKFSDRWAMDLALTPSMFTDYENTSSDAFRMTARAIAMWTANERWQWAFGVVYLDREDIVALPAAGAIWTPNEDYKVELMFPRPRILKRLSSDGDTSRWAFLAGELGGGSWAIDRADGTPDVFTYSSLRLLVGYEVKKARGFAPHIEAGYVFNRKVEYESDNGNYDPDSTVMIRVGSSF